MLRATVLLIVGRYVGENPLQPVLNPLLVALIVVFASWLGALWARRSQDPLVGARLLGQLRLADRQAALDLLRESVRLRQDAPTQVRSSSLICLRKVAINILPVGAEVRRARSGPGRWPGLRRQARGSALDTGAQGRVPLTLEGPTRKTRGVRPRRL